MVRTKRKLICQYGRRGSAAVARAHVPGASVITRWLAIELRLHFVALADVRQTPVVIPATHIYALVRKTEEGDKRGQGTEAILRSAQAHPFVLGTATGVVV